MKKQPDYILLSVLAIIIVAGVVILASVSAPYALEKFGNSYYFLAHQLLFGFLPGIVLAIFAFFINLSFLKKIAPLLFLINLVIMVMVFLPLIGSPHGGASRWIGFGSFSFQPAELLKLTSILYLASLLSARTEKKESNQIFFVFLAIIGIISMLLIWQPNISTLGVIVFTAFLIYFAAKTPVWHIGLFFLTAAAGLLFLIKIAPYRFNRFLVFLNPGIDPMGIGYQAKQSLIAVGSGGIKGVGFGMSSQKLGFLPQSIADSIFAVFSEEFGFIGAIFLIALFLIFLLRGFKIAKDAPDKFSQLAVIGITSWIVIQAFVNIGAMIGILPLTGIPLPFVSYGGSALIMELIGAGILLNISKQS